MKKVVYEFTIYLCVVQEISWQKRKDRSGKWKEYVYIKLGVTDVGRLPERMEEIPGSIGGYCIPLVAVTIRMEIEHPENESIPDWETTRRGFEKELRERMRHNCFVGDVFWKDKETKAGECTWVQYYELVNRKSSNQFITKFYNNIIEQKREWKSNNPVIKNINIFNSVEFNDDSRDVLRVCKDYQVEGNRTMEVLHKYSDVLYDLYKKKLIDEINAGHLRLAASGEYGLSPLDSLMFPKATGSKEFRQKDKAIHWITGIDRFGKTYISHVTEVVVENPDKDALRVSFENKNVHRGTYTLDELTQHYKNGDNLVEILPHNRWAIDQGWDLFRRGVKMFCMPRCCGTGKSYIALGFTYLFEKVLIVTNRDSIKDQFKEVVGNRATFINYQSLKNTDQLRGYDLITFDECHHLEAAVWKTWALKLISNNSEVRVLGLTATPERNDGINIIDSFFGGIHIADLTLPQAWSDGLLQIPEYYTGSYKKEEDLKDLEEMEEIVEKSVVSEENKQEARLLINKIRIDWEKSGGVPDILKNYLPSYVKKVIVFCENIDHLNSMRNTIESWFINSGWRPTMLEIHSKNSRKTNLYNINDFKSSVKDSEIKVMLSVDMFNEGIHVPGVGALIFLRRTSSSTVYLQHIGRCLSVGKDGEKPIVLDLVGNIYNVGFGGILRYKKELDEIESIKIARGEKKEDERLTIEIQGNAISQIELFERIESLCNTTNYYLKLLENIKSNNWEGIDSVDTGLRYFIRSHSGGRDNYTIFEICVEAKSVMYNRQTELRDWANNMIQTNDFSDLVGLGKSTRQYRWFGYDVDLGPFDLVNIKNTILNKWIELNPEFAKSKKRTKGDKINLVKQMNESMDYSSVIGNRRDKMLRNFIVDNKDSIPECSIAYENASLLFHNKRTREENINLVKQMNESMDYSSVIGNKGDKNLRSFINNYKDSIPECSIAYENLSMPFEADRAKKINLVKQMNESMDYSSVIGAHCTHWLRNFINNYKDSIPECNIAYENIKNLSLSYINLKNIRDIIEKEAWDEARVSINPNLYRYVLQHRKGGRGKYIEEAEIVWQHIKSNED